MAGALPDDPGVPNDEQLLRRIPPRHFFPDPNLGRLRPSTAAFEDDPDGSPMSVFLASRLIDVRDALVGHEGYALAAIPAGLARDCKQAIVPAPSPDAHPAALAHALVVGKKPKSVRNRFAHES